MPADCCHTRAVARWLSGGVRSSSHRLLAVACRDHFGRIGIQAEWLECEPFGALENGPGECWLRSPQWNAADVDPTHPDASAVLAAAALGEPPHVDGLGMLQFADADGERWPAIRASIAAGTAAAHFLHAAAVMLLVDPVSAELYASGDDEAYATRVRAFCDLARSEALPATPAAPFRTPSPLPNPDIGARATDYPGTSAVAARDTDAIPTPAPARAVPSPAGRERQS